MKTCNVITAACAAALSTTLASSPAAARLIVDLRLPPSVSDNPKHVILPTAAPQQSVEIDIYVVIIGTKSGFDRVPLTSGMPPQQIGWNYTYDYADGFQSLSGSIGLHPFYEGWPPAVPDNISGIYPNGYAGLVSAYPYVAARGSTPGNTIDLNADGFIDLGAPNGTPSAQASNYINIRTPNTQLLYGIPDNPLIDPLAYIDSTDPRWQRPPDPLSREFLVGKVVLWLEKPTPFPCTDEYAATYVNWHLRRDADGKVDASAARWMEDRLPEGTTQESDLLNGVTGTINTGSPVWVAVIPEPSPLALVLPATLTLTRRRHTARPIPNANCR